MACASVLRPLIRESEVSRNAFSSSSNGLAWSSRAARRRSGGRPVTLLSMANRAAILCKASRAIGDAVA